MNLRETFAALDKREIERYIEVGEQENLHLDFKTLNDPTFNRDDRKILSEAISGFANSDGGILIIGVNARKNEEQIDCAQSLQLIDNLARSFSNLNSYIGQSTTPIVDGVLAEAVDFGDDKGCLKIFVPASESTPHMAKLGDDRYHKRSGSSFYRMEHFDLEDMFGRRQKPKLDFHWKRSSVPSDPTEDILFFLINRGRGAAKHIQVIIEALSSIDVVSVQNPLSDLSAINEMRPVYQFSDNQGVIHPVEVNFSLGSLKMRQKNIVFAAKVTVSCEGIASRTSHNFIT